MDLLQFAVPCSSREQGLPQKRANAFKPPDEDIETGEGSNSPWHGDAGRLFELLLFLLLAASVPFSQLLGP